MKIHNTVLAVLTPILFLFFVFTSADAFQVKITPSKVNPGDAFVIKASGTDISECPDAFLNKKRISFSNCGEGCFIAIGAVDIETKPGVYRVRLNIVGKAKRLGLVVKPAKFSTLFITLPWEKVFLSPEDLERAEREEERLKALWQTVTDRLWDGSFMIPLDNKTSTGFGTKRIVNRRKISIHRGIDIRGKEGEEVRASNRGRVVLAEELFFGGNTVILDHGQGIFTVYMHLSAFAVKPDDIVPKGDIVGFVGSSGRSSGPHLHFGVKVRETSANPASFVRLKL